MVGENMKKGLTLITVSMMVLIIIILATTVTITGASVLDRSKKMKFASELIFLQEAIENYQLTHEGQLPIKEATVLAENLPEGEYHLIDMSLLGLIQTTYGRKQNQEEQDQYVLNNDTKEVYYLKGLKIGNQIYYHLNEELKKIIQYNDQEVVTKDGIVFKPSETKATNQAITVEVQIPSEYTDVSVMSQGVEVTSAVTNENRTIYTITKNSNFDIVVNYVKKGVPLKQVYTVSNFDQEKPWIAIKNQIVMPNGKTSITFETGDSLSGVKQVQYEIDKVSEEYFQVDKKGTLVENQNVIVEPYIKYVTFYVEDKAGNFEILTVTLNVHVSEKDYTKYGLVLQYDGINNTGNGHSNLTSIWKDLSGNGRDGKLNGFENTSSSSWSKDALEFDGKDDWINYVPITLATFTIEVVYTTNDVASNLSQIMIGSEEGKGMELGSYQGSTYGLIRTQDGNQQVKSDFYPVDNVVFASLTYDQMVQKLYVFANLADQSEFSGTIDVPKIATIGANLKGENLISNCFNGSIYAIRVYNRALTEDEIKQNYLIDKARFAL